MNVLLTVDVDFAGYDPLYAHRCSFNPAFIDDVQRTLDLIGEETGGQAMLLPHTSPFIRRQHRDIFFTDDRYLDIWREHARRGGSLGIHPHEEEPNGSVYYYYYPGHIKSVLQQALARLQRAGLHAQAVRFGYCAGNERLFPVLEELHLPVLLDNMGGNWSEVYAWWAGAPTEPYHPSCRERTRPGHSGVWVVPIAFSAEDNLTGWKSLIPEALTERETCKLWDRTASRRAGPVTVLIHAHAVRDNGAKLRRALRYISAHGGVWQATISPPEHKNWRSCV